MGQPITADEVEATRRTVTIASFGIAPDVITIVGQRHVPRQRLTSRMRLEEKAYIIDYRIAI